MHVLLIVIAVILLDVSGVSAKSACWDKARTQLELNDCAFGEFQQADNELNAVYQKILKEYANDPIFIEKLKKAQLAWLKFRDAEMAAIFPEEKPTYYGSAHPMCHSSWMTQLTQQRTKELRRWLNGRIEGDICAGSIK